MFWGPFTLWDCDLLAVHTTSIFWGDVGGQKVQGLKGAGGYLGIWIVGGVLELCSMQQLLELTLFELSIVSDFVKCVRLHNLPILKDCVQQVLENHRETGLEGGGGWGGNEDEERRQGK